MFTGELCFKHVQPIVAESMVLTSGAVLRAVLRAFLWRANGRTAVLRAGARIAATLKRVLNQEHGSAVNVVATANGHSMDHVARMLIGTRGYTGVDMTLHSVRYLL